MAITWPKHRFRIYIFSASYRHYSKINCQLIIMENKLEELRDELMFEKKKNSRLANELEESEIRLMDLLEKIRELENSTVKEL